ncbi:hypothetical protein LOK49_LG08G02778 [Camellia lanceoleosa]|uniref:Uncharacterized protein n=1 Tax=Camellia lanceoleosa TaxID=1840588 RepID=A0ACC0GX73_9ERIC|nr:hypothetical protein LOK49_LG08G02778 [Camellia lanceoleosa]
MSKTLHLHKSLTTREISRLKNEILKSEGVKTLVSSDETYLLELALSEKLEDLNRVAGVVSRLGKKCSVPALQGFEHVYGDIVRGAIDVKELGFLVKDMDGMVRKMERYVNSTANLYSEMEVLNELEIATKKFQQNQHEESRKAFEQKLMWQKQDVRHLKDVSLWNQTYDKVVELLARTACTIYARICMKRRADVSPRLASHRAEVLAFRPQDFNFACGTGPGRLFMECLSLSSSASKVDDDDDGEGVGHDDRSSQTSASCSVASAMKRELPNHSGWITRAQSGALFSGDQWQAKCSAINGSRFGLKSRLALYAPPSTIGGSALALHYANVIIVIEKLLRYPHLVGEEARDDLYQMLPTSLKMTLKTSLKSCVKDLAIYDAPLAHDWKERRWDTEMACPIST